MRLLDGGATQRLRRIAQLGLTELVYPGARHTRFEHAIGTAAVVTRLFAALRGRLGLDRWFGGLGIPANDGEYERLLGVARAAALLHDLGHPPFSHVTESLLPAGETHEDRTLRLLGDGEVAAALAAAGGNLASAVRDCLDPRRGPEEPRLAFVREAISGPLGADRLDYLLRDSRATGVSYGIFDLDRIIHTIVPLEREDGAGARLGITRGGVLAAEGMLWARFSMFEQVYRHRTRRILDLHLRAFLAGVLPGGRYPAPVPEYLEWDDPRIWVELRGALADRRHTGHAEARRLLRREHHRALPGRIEGGSASEVAERLEAWRAAVAAKDPAAAPIADLVEWGSDESAEIPVVEESGERVPLARVSALAGRLALAPYGRLYVAQARRDALVAVGRGTPLGRGSSSVTP
jgi:HD superfamily phosphohydrolase